MDRRLMLADDLLVKLIDDTDKNKGTRLLKAKRYSIEHLRKDGYSDQQIEDLLNIKL